MKLLRLIRWIAGPGGAASLCLCFGASAQAGVPQSEIQEQDFTVNALGGFGTLTFDQFDDDGGCRVLQEVKLTCDWIVNGDFSLTNNANFDCNGTVDLIHQEALDFPAGGAQECTSGEEILDLPIVNLPPGDTATFPDVIDLTHNTMTSFTMDLDQFIGLGTIDAAYSSVLGVLAQINCDNTNSTDTLWDGTITVEYIFIEVIPSCEIDGPDLVCPGTTDISYTVVETSVPPLENVTFSWSLTGDGSFCGPTDGDTVCVNADDVCGGVIDLTVTVTTDTGCTNTCTYSVTVDDLEDPVITCPPDATFPCEMGDAGEATATDNCPPDPVITFNDVVISESCPRVIERTWTATDACDNTDSCVQTITIDDTIDPVITCPPDATFQCEMGNAGEATATDNCPIDPVITSNDVVISESCPRVIERTWTATDGCDNTDSCVQTITIDDTIDPVITCPPDATFQCMMGDAGEATATDNCPIDPVITSNDVVVSESCPRIIERTWTATDGCDNTDSCVQTITIDDTIDPVITCPPDATFQCEMGDAGEATATDNCPIDPVITFNDVVISESCPRVIERTWTATDGCDNTDSCVQTITIDDTEPPAVTDCPVGPPIETCDPYEFTVGVEDNCPDPTLACSVEFTEGNGTLEDLGGGSFRLTFTEVPAYATVTCTATDACDNVSDPCEFVVNCDPCEGEIGDFIWLDENQDGCQDDTEDGIEGVTVTLFRNCANPEFVAETMTDVDGFYLFEDLCADEYLVVIDAPEGLVETTPNACDDGAGGIDDENDSDCDGGSICVVLPENDSSDLTNDCGFVCTGVIGDRVWNDENQNGCQDETEPAGIAGVTVTLYDACLNGAVVETTMTDADGFYEFTGLCEGDYLVVIEAPAGYVETVPNACDDGAGGIDDENDSDCEGGLICVNLPSNDTVDLTNDCGLYIPGGGEGCTPGYWKQPHHFFAWTAPYTPDTLFCDVFFGDFPGDECAFEGLTLLQVLKQPASAQPGPNQLNSLGRHTVAALLNAASANVAFDFTVSDVIGSFNAAYPGSNSDYNDLKSMFASSNEAGCPLGNEGGPDDPPGVVGSEPQTTPERLDSEPTPRPGISTNPGVLSDTPSSTPGPTVGSSSNERADGGPSLGEVDREGRVIVTTERMAPGDHGGLLEIGGDFVQREGDLLVLEIRGLAPIVGHDVLEVTGRARLDGGLEVQFVDEFVPHVGDRFEVVRAHAVAGAFGTTSLPALPGGDELSVTYEPGSVVLVVQPAPVVGDLNRDSFVDYADLLLLLERFGEVNSSADLNGDGTIGAADVSVLLRNWGRHDRQLAH